MKEERKMKEMIYDIKTIIVRELMIYKNDISLLFMVLTQPILWFILLGYGIGSMMDISHTTLKVDYMSYILPGIIGITSVNGGLYGGASLLNDIRFGHLERYIISPVSMKSFLMGKIIAICIQVCLQIFIIICFAFLLGIKYINIVDYLCIMIISMLFSTIMTNLSLFLCTFFKTHNSLYAFIAFINIPLMLMSNSFYVYELLPRVYKMILLLNPLTHYLNIIRYKLGLEYFSYKIIFTECVFLMFMIIVFMIINFKRFDVFIKRIY